jgi:hypothetical protein
VLLSSAETPRPPQCTQAGRVYPLIAAHFRSARSSCKPNGGAAICYENVARNRRPSRRAGAVRFRNICCEIVHKKRSRRGEVRVWTHLALTASRAASSGSVPSVLCSSASFVAQKTLRIAFFGRYSPAPFILCLFGPAPFNLSLLSFSCKRLRQAQLELGSSKASGAPKVASRRSCLASQEPKAT